MLPLFLALFLAPPAEEWSRFRGPNGTGVASAAAIPDEIGPDKNVAWRTELPNGYSSPVLTANTVFLTGWQGLKIWTFAIDRASGAIRWKTESPKPLAKEHRTVNTPVSPSPVTDGTNAYVFLDNFGLISYDSAGKERWRHELGPFTMPYGAGSSPVLAGRTLLLLVDQDVKSYLLAVDKDTGKQLWKTDRSHATHGFSTPVIHNNDVIVSGAYELNAYDLKTGARKWWVSEMARQAKSVPVVHNNMLYVHSWMAAPAELGHKEVTLSWAQALAEYDKNKNGAVDKEEYPDESLRQIWFLYDLDDDGVLGETDWQYLLARGQAKNGLYAIRLGGKGDVTKTHVLWRYDKGLPNIPSPLLYNDVLYVLREGGILTALNPKDGSVLKQGRVEGAVDAYFASPVAAEDKIITASKDGKVALVKPGADWQVAAVADFGEEIWSTPAISRNQLFLRTSKALYCFEAKRG